MTARTFDPFAVERPILKLGDHGQWVLGDITDPRQEKLEALGDQLELVGKREGVTVADIAVVVGDFAEAACDNAEGLSALLVDLTDTEKHGADAVGAFGLKGIAEFVKDHVLGEGSAGEG